MSTDTDDTVRYGTAEAVRRSWLCGCRRASAEGRARAPIRQRIEVGGLTQMQAAQLMGVSQPDLSRILCIGISATSPPSG